MWQQTVAIIIGAIFILLDLLTLGGVAAVQLISPQKMKEMGVSIN